MNVTYQREVGHCSKSNYVKEYTVGSISPAENSDSLDVAKFKEIDYQTVVKRGSVNVGDKLFFIPPESVLPFELSEELGITKYLSNGRVRITHLLAEDKIAYLETLPWIGKITKYHLARNIGIDTVKPDRHLTRLAAKYGYTSPLEMCIDIQTTIPEKLGVIDVILWRYCNLNRGKLEETQ